jgi:hypothetical protein
MNINERELNQTELYVIAGGGLTTFCKPSPALPCLIHSDRPYPGRFFQVRPLPVRLVR